MFVQSFEIIFSLRLLRYCSDLLSIFSMKAFAFEWKNLILHAFFFQFEGRGSHGCSNCNYFYQPCKSEGCKCDYRVQVHMPVARGGIRGVQPSPSHTHTYTHTQVFKQNFEKIYYIYIPLCSFFISNLVLRNLKVLNF